MRLLANIICSLDWRVARQCENKLPAQPALGIAHNIVHSTYAMEMAQDLLL